MSKPRKTDKVEEPAGTYFASPQSSSKAPNVRYARRKDVMKTNEKLMRIHRRVLEKLAK